MEAPLDVGVLSNGSLRQWQVDALEKMVEEGARIDCVIVNGKDDSRIRYNLRNAPGYLIIAGMRELAIRFFGSSPFLRPVALSSVECLAEANRVVCDPIPQPDYGHEIPRDIVNEHCANLDFLVRFGFGIVRGPVLNAPTHGVFSFHHGDLRKYRGRPAGYWEFMNNEPVVGVTLQQLTEELDGGRIIEITEVDVGHCDTYQDVLQTLYTHSTDMLRRAVQGLREGCFSPTQPDMLGQLYTAPGLRSAAKYLVKNTKRRVERHW